MALYFSSMDSNTVLLTIGVAIYLIIYWRKGGNQASTDANTSLKSVADARKMEIDDLKERVSTCEKLHRENLTERGRMQGIIEEKDKRIVVLESVDISRNPVIVSFIENSAKREERILDAMKQISDFMQKLNTHMETKA